jgi:hypothetical protein
MSEIKNSATISVKPGDTVRICNDGQYHGATNKQIASLSGNQWIVKEVVCGMLKVSDGYFCRYVKSWVHCPGAKKRGGR